MDNSINENINPWIYDYSGDSGTGMIKPISVEGVDEEEMHDAINTAVDNLVDGAPEELNTIGELANAILDDEDIEEELREEINAKLNISTYEADKVNFVRKEDLPTKVSDLENDLNFTTDEAVEGKLETYFNNAAYNSDAKLIEFKHNDNTLVTIDASDFIKDGMIDEVKIVDGNLIITFNTESGKEPISIPLTDIFNPDNYYTKDETDSLLAAKANVADVYTKNDVDSKLAEKANTADVETALAGKANTGDSYTKSEEDTLLAAKANVGDVYTKSDVDTKLSEKANISDVYTKSDVDTKLEAKANVGDSYTKDEADVKLSEKANVADVYTKGETDTALNAKADTTFVETELAKKADTENVYTKEETDNKLAEKANVGESYTKAEEDELLAVKADSDDLAAVATSGSYNDLEDKPEIPVVPTNVSAFVNDAGYLTEHQSLEDYPTKEEMAEADNTVKKDVFTKIWSNPTNVDNGYFQTKYVNTKGNEAMLWNESDGGGALFRNKVANINSFVGVNEDNADGVCVQIYSKDATTNQGSRLNANPNGIYYGVGTSASIVPEKELAVKGDIAEAVEDLAKKSDIPVNVSQLNNDAGYLTEHQSLSNYINNVDYNSEAKAILFKHDETVLDTIDATPFIKDGMISNVEITDGNLVITFNTDSGKEPITIPLTEIFNPENYYTKDETDAKFATKEESEAGDEAAKKAVFAKIWSNPTNVDNGYFQTKYVNADNSTAMLWNESDGGGALFDNKTTGVKTFVGVNNGEGNIYAQIYSKNASTNQGSRLNVNPDGIYYGVGTSASIVPEKELAVKGDIPVNVSQLNNDAGYLTQHQSLEDYPTKEEMTEADNAVKNAVFSKIWSNPSNIEKGWFKTVYTNTDGSYAQIWNESDGGGSQFYNSSENIITYVGVNSEGRNGVCAQIYSKDKATNEGSRLNVNPTGIYYGVGTSASIVPEKELAVKGDIATDRAEVDAIIAEKDAKITELNNNLYSLKQIVGNIGGDVTYDLPNEGKSFNALMQNNGTVKMSEDVTTGRFGPGVMASNTVTLNLNSHTLTVNTTGDAASILARGTETVTIKGTGANSKIVNETADKIVWCAGSATVNIQSGNFIGQGTDGSEVIYCESGTINITGGTFRSNCPDKRYLLNCKDGNFAAGTAKILISSTSTTSGPKFYDFDPSNNPEGEGTTYVAEGNHVISSTVTEEGVEYTVYTVVKG